MSGVINKKDIHKHEQTRAVVSDNVKNYADEPFFIDKATKARITLERVGLPGQKKNQLAK